MQRREGKSRICLWQVATAECRGPVVEERWQAEVVLNVTGSGKLRAYTYGRSCLILPRLHCQPPDRPPGVSISSPTTTYD